MEQKNWMTTLLILLFSALFSFFLHAEKPRKNKFFTPTGIAILGDELSLGRGAYPDLDIRTPSLVRSFSDEERGGAKSYTERFLSLLLGGEEVVEGSPKLLWPSFREFSESLTWVLRHFTLALSRLATDFPKLSWGHMTALSLGVKSENLIVAALPGGGVASMKDQYDSVQMSSEGSSVDTYFISLSGADLCESSPSHLMKPNRFYKNFLGFLDYLIEDRRKLENPKPLQFVFLNYLGVTLFRGSEEFMKRKIVFKGEKKAFSCQDVLEGRESFFASNLKEEDASLELFSLGKIFPEDPKVFCPTLFSRESFAEASLSFSSNFDSDLRRREIRLSMEDQMSHLAGLIRSYRAKMGEAIHLREKEARAVGISLFYVKSIENVRFTLSDLSTNCVDLSSEGHRKIWEELTRFLESSRAFPTKT